VRQAAVVDDDPKVRKRLEIGDEELGVARAQDEYRQTMSHGRAERNLCIPGPLKFSTSLVLRASKRSAVRAAMI